ncbi:MAG: SCO family protein [Gammaproteobacteria bacterium]|nr:SCO family protein [Gammaproteobacteria bacterium]
MKTNKNGKWVLLAIAALFLAGFIAAYVLVAIGWRPSVTKNYGELVQPARPIDNVAVRELDGTSVNFNSLRGKWTLLYFGSAECLKPCVDNLYKMRQLVDAQGQQAHRLQRVFVVTDARALDALRYTLADYPQTRVLLGDTESVRQLAMQFALKAGSPLDNLHRLYVVDPIGNFMMSYPADADLRRMNKDIGLLLRTSQLG